MARKELSPAHRCFCENVIARRKELGFTQVEMAAKLGVSQPAWAGYERGANEPTISLMARIADSLECDLAELVSVRVGV